MTIDIREGQMIIDAQGREVLNSRNRFLHTMTARVAGRRDFGAIGSSGGVISRVETFPLGACHAKANFVYGAIKFDVAGTGNAFPFNRWHTIFGQGEVVWVMDGEAGFRQRLGSNLGLTQWCSYSFRASGGQVFMDRLLFLSDTPLMYVIRAHAITYRLKAGRFT